jgi:hypothetical protein
MSTEMIPLGALYPSLRGAQGDGDPVHEKRVEGRVCQKTRGKKKP